MENIHEYLDDGIKENTKIQMFNFNKKVFKDIKDIIIGDILENGSIVYGLVEIDARKLRKYKNKNKYDKLYHLLTTNGSLMVNSIDIKDYNNLIDEFII